MTGRGREILQAIVLMTILYGGSAMADQLPRSLVTIDCPTEAPEPEVLCQKLAEALVAAAPKHDIRVLGPGDTLQPKSGSITLTLRIDAVSEHRIGGHLEWHDGENLHSGPRVDLDVMDTTISPMFYNQFVTDLIRATPQLLADNG